jgi:hypothetical protein
MTIPMIGILIVAGIAMILGVFCMISEFISRKRKNEMYDEVPEGYWEKLEEYLENRDPLPPEAEGDDPEPFI